MGFFFDSSREGYYMTTVRIYPHQSTLYILTLKVNSKIADQSHMFVANKQRETTDFLFILSKVKTLSLHRKTESRKVIVFVTIPIIFVFHLQSSEL